VKQKRRAVGRTRRRSLRVSPRDAGLLPRLEALKADQPVWGSRHVWAYWRFVEPLPVHKTRVLRVRREPHLLAPPHLRLQAKRTPTGSKPRPTKPNEWWGIDMTTVLVEGFSWVSVVAVLDWYTKVIGGYDAGIRGTAKDWLAALDMARNRQFPLGVRGDGLSLMSANGSQPTSLALIETCSTRGIPQAFTSYSNPEGNADTERVIRTRKGECLGLQERACPLRRVSSLEAGIDDYNDRHLRSALG
jgi:putative transposase